MTLAPLAPVHDIPLCDRRTVQTDVATRAVGPGEAQEILPSGHYQTDPQAFHLWLRLPEPWRRAAFASHMRSQGVHTVVSDAFAVSSEPPEAVRMCLGGAATRDDIRRALELTADALREPRTTEAAFF